jgi:hypothetical protein
VSLHDRRERFDNDALHANAKSNAQASEILAQLRLLRPRVSSSDEMANTVGGLSVAPFNSKVKNNAMMYVQYA